MIDRDVLIHTCTILARLFKQELYFTSGSAAFTAGEVVTGANGATITVDLIAVVAGSWDAGTAVGTIVGRPSGTFVEDEVITSERGRAAAAGPAEDYELGLGSKTPTWQPLHANEPCYAYYPKGGRRYLKAVEGETQSFNPWIVLRPTVSLGEGHDRRITTSSPSFAGTYAIGEVRSYDTEDGPDHIEAELVLDPNPLGA